MIAGSQWFADRHLFGIIKVFEHISPLRLWFADRHLFGIIGKLDLVVIDEARRVRNMYKKGNKTVTTNVFHNINKFFMAVA